MASYVELKENIILGEEDKVADIIRTLLDGGSDPTEIMFEGLIRGMSEVGQKMKSGEMFIPEVLVSAHAVGLGMERLKPLIASEDLSTIYKGKIIMGTVQGDVHNIGKKIVSMILESGGFTVLDLGVDVPAERFVDTVGREQPNILGLSALLTTTMANMEEIVKKIKEMNPETKILVGGAPLNDEFRARIGADFYSPDPRGAVEYLKEIAA